MINGWMCARSTGGFAEAHRGHTQGDGAVFGQLADNIRYGRSGSPGKRVIAAAKAAQAHDFILKLPEGYNTHIEERASISPAVKTAHRQCNRPAAPAGYIDPG